MIKLAVSGAHGRMGQSITRLALEDKTFTMTTLLEHAHHAKLNEQSFGMDVTSDANKISDCDVMIDFTLPDGTITNLETAVKNNVKLVIGTTGFSEDQIKKIEEASKTIPIVFSTNMSIGVNILFKLIEVVGKKINDPKMTLSETHHVHKKDAPSGTAKTMAEFAEKTSGKKIADIESIREGEVIGDHEITFETKEDILKISHHAKSRDMFAKGSLTAAKFLVDKTSGLYHMQDVLGLNEIKIQ